MKRLLLIAPLAFAAAFSLGCSSSGGDKCLSGDNCDDGNNNGQGPGNGAGPGGPGGDGTGTAAAPPPLCTTMGADHVGLGGVKLTDGRVAAIAGADRGRMKPYSALTGEYKRVLGADNNPTLVSQVGSTFGLSPARWYAEPAPNAVSLYTALRVGFDGCLQLTGAVANGKGTTTGDAKYGVAPTADTAKAECTAWTRSFWSRDASPEEIQACVDVAITDSVKEMQTNGQTVDATPQRQWAYACATVLSATGFLSY